MEKYILTLCFEEAACPSSSNALCIYSHGALLTPARRFTSASCRLEPDLRLASLDRPVADVFSVYGMQADFQMFGTSRVSFITRALTKNWLPDLHVSQLLPSEAGHAAFVTRPYIETLRNTRTFYYL